MPLHVHLPLQVRLVEPITARELALLEQAVGDACRTALLTVRHEVVDVRGDGRRIVVDRPDPVFTGSIPAEGVREAAAAAVTRGLTRAISSSGLLQRKGMPQVRTEHRSDESLDASRVREHEGGSTYRIPSYDHGGEEAAVPLLDDRRAGKPASYWRPAAGQSLTLARALTVAWDAHVARNGAKWDPASCGYPGYAGLVSVKGGPAEATLVWISQVDRIQPDGRILEGEYDPQYHPFELLKWQKTGGRAEFHRDTLTGDLGAYQELVRTDRPATVDELEKMTEELLDERHEPASHPLRDPVARRRYAERLLSGAQGPRVICRVTGDQQLFATMRSNIQSPIRFVTALPPGPPEPKAKTGPGQAAPPAKRPAKPAPRPGVKPGSKPAPPKAPKKPPGAKGTAAGTDAASRPGAGDDESVRGTPGRPQGKGRGNIWPLTGIKGEELTCSPYAGEPSLLRLPYGVARLKEGMLRIARLLDVPDNCTYAGMFTVNCARLIATRAHGVGLATLKSDVTSEVTVRGDGKGNNGFLDLRPGQAPELQFMRMLGEVAGLVRELANDVAAMYEHPANAALVRPYAGQAGAQAASWGLQFLKDVREHLTTGCMYMYAETCRVLLLQQLRSSRAAIEERRGGHKEETLQHFTQALDVLGGSVVKLLVLRRAVRHAERTGVTGTVRQVLSARETKYRAGYHESHYEAPAPIAAVDAQTLSQLEGSRIEREATAYVAVHGGRSWTVGQLEEGINARRALVNQVDPIFFQVEDIEELLRSAHADPSHVWTYLTALLGRMATANEEMTRKTREEEGGAFFALETSHWIAKEGGKDHRGIQYTLKGIHGMADEELRPYVGGLPEYALGVNLAIGRKAHLDTVLKVAGTVGIVVLALLCAPLGATVAGLISGAASVALAYRDYQEAEEQKQLYRSLEDPEALLRWQEVETAQLMAAIGLAFAVFDLGHTAMSAKIVGRAAQTVKAARQAAHAAERTVAKQVWHNIVANTTEELLKHALAQAVTQIVITEVMDTITAKVLGPVIMEWSREQGLLHGTLDTAEEPAPAGGPASQPAAGPTPAPANTTAPPPPPPPPHKEGKD
ncbi:hypothetical protein [Streptomyces sp. NRRL S-337]|uniref:hypothetical protein n=1 Tax=Streptomyces sp. NRRL S-337 TaxID=1463900 RepID=UPI0004C8681D|nr:hypothetical protein [Streptomyces sp. NRRL S-337]